ncbi:MAG TPA: PIG-L family deacetylase [Acidisarcina sp.]
MRKLHTRASLIAIVAHPDDEDGGTLTYESRGQGVDTTLLTLNRGEGGQNAMSSDFWDQLGLVRTEELLAADEYYGVHQYFTRVADFGFSKTIEESMKLWGHDRVLYDAVRVVRMTRPLVVTSSFAGNVSDGHGQHQVSGAIAQEVFKAAADPKMFPDQIKAGLLPWAPLKVYARVPSARTGEKGIYDSATGHWEPVRFRNYVDDTYIAGIPSETVSVPSGEYDPLLRQSYFNISREGLGRQKSQNGGLAIPPVRPVFSPYHLYASRVGAILPPHEEGFFAGIDVSLAGIADYAPVGERSQWRARLANLNTVVEEATVEFDAANPSKIASLLASGLTQTESLLAELARSSLSGDVKYNMTHELLVKQRQFNDALGEALGVSMLATVTDGSGNGASVTGMQPSTVIAGQRFGVDLHVVNEGRENVTVNGTDLRSFAGPEWKFVPPAGRAEVQDLSASASIDRNVTVTVPESAELTRPYFDRPSVEQPYYDIRDLRYLNEPETPYPLTAELQYSYHGVEAHITTTVQAARLSTSQAAGLDPLLVAPAISVTVDPQAGIVPLGSTTFHLNVTVHSSVKSAARGAVHLELPHGWSALPSLGSFEMSRSGDENVIGFEVTPKSAEPEPYVINAVAECNGRQYREGFQMAGYPGLRPYPYYRRASYRTAGVDVKLAPGLKLAYIMGTGDDVPRSLENLGLRPVQLSAQDLAGVDLSGYDAIVIGIRAYGARPELKTAKDRLLDYVKQGGVVIVQYQAGDYDHNFAPYPLSFGGDPARVVEEDKPVTILVPQDPILSWPNKITSADFNGWVEERGHGFMRSWDPHFVALTEMHDASQEPQEGGLLYAHYGDGAYVYTAYAFFRQMPEGVPGSFRIFSNLISIGKNPAFHAATSRAH